MESAYISAVAALVGSAIGALSSFMTTWLTQTSARQVAWADRDRARRESLYGEFIEEMSAVFVDALTSELTDVSKMVKPYSLMSRMRLFASEAVIRAAEEAMETIIAVYRAPNIVRSDAPFDGRRMDPLRPFSEACRAELDSM